MESITLRRYGSKMPICRRGREGVREMMKFENIEVERTRLGLSKDAFAKSLGIAIKTYYNWLNGVNPIPSDSYV